MGVIALTPKSNLKKKIESLSHAIFNKDISLKTYDLFIGR